MQAKARHYLQPLKEALPDQMHERLVVTFPAPLTSILRLGNTRMGILLSGLGSYVTGYAHAPLLPSESATCCEVKNGTLRGSMPSFLGELRSAKVFMIK